MVVLEEGSMLTTGPHQYLQPDYLSPLPTTLDAKKSPLALLAQTCSQIGADSSSKPLISSMDKPAKGSSSARSPPAAKLERTRSSPSENKSTSNLAFKPYETNVVAKSRPVISNDDITVSSRPASKASSVHSVPDSASNSASVDMPADSSFSKKSSTSRSTPQGRKSSSPSNQHQTTTNNSECKTPDKSSPSPRHGGASPIIRSGMEILSGAKDAASFQSMYKAQGLGAYGASSLCCPPGLAENPAFRPPFAGASPFSHHHAAAAALLGYPGAAAAAAAAAAAGSANANPYLSYARVKTPSGGETLVPVCKDPYCTGCQYSMHNAQMMMAAAASGASPTCPSGCTQCDHQKYGLMALSSLGQMPPPLTGYPGALTGAAAAAAVAAGGRPHICNWIAGDSYCGKRFASSEELLQHLRSHTSADPAALLAAGQHPHPLLSPSAALRAAAAGTYPAPSLSPLSARYHPYGKPPTGPLPASLAASPYSAFNALSPYYSPYAIYGQRIGAAVHP